ncbi:MULTISPECIES: SURF1 family protein [Agrobacterium tumefaciens complex]|uniref:SURF1-like protein n=1 Tax=Agrobacterium tumefaciens str. Kerr 14 TaxID=1183424 RepID=A0A1S7NJF1_AGRTU|nr:SURF1 family protein [Agrobacterium tumefaciens]EHH04728.1 surfeit 1 [Agrobacterium tumefaciens CCNWGS0286]MBP2536916.1 surfeit locus 1 family protein [Agrobacterium tumefaciens]MDP9870559.1 surfeit locus 1 family protein [Agrobacterium tumefaciens]MDP9977722.1 surfeit locus 1 family protein [Agrobacterium tumefaciens]CUX07949.1 Surfeit 1 [Agrobacterium tumefaciens str. Kerr 14]
MSDTTPHNRRIRPAAIIVLFLTVVLTGLLLVLGTWQVKRLSWKLDLIERIEARAHADPVDAPAAGEWPALKDPAEYEYRRVKLSGTFLNDREVQVYTVTDLGPGYWVMTPLKRDDGSSIIVNRGFVPSDRRDPSSRREGEPAGNVEITGLMRAPETGGLFLRTNDPANGRWYSRNIPQISQASGLSDVAPFYVDADATPNPDGLPVGGKTMLTFPNNHLSYAVTWYILAAMVVAAGWYVLHNLNAPKSKRGED